LGHCVLNIGTCAFQPQITGQMMQSAQTFRLVASACRISLQQAGFESCDEVGGAV
jgi:hypothetical protein